MLNEKEKKLLSFIISEIRSKGYPPSIREMKECIGVKSLRGVTYHLNNLQKKGFIHRESLSRSISILPRSYSLKNELNDSNEDRFISIPILGKIAAGNPIFAEENITDYIHVSKQIAKDSNNYYALRVTGDSMLGDHILDNDIVIIKKQNYAKDGEIIVAILNDEATIKRVFIEKGYYRLQPSNPKYEPLLTTELIIGGVLVGLIRNYNNLNKWR